jgi:hypothetical protein
MTTPTLCLPIAPMLLPRRCYPDAATPMLLLVEGFTQAICNLNLDY